MKILQDMIMENAEIKPGGIIGVSNFLNHKMDIKLIDKIGQEFYQIFKDTHPTIILTVEASGIGIACLTARYFGIDIIFAKKTQSKNLTEDTYSSLVRSYTKGMVFDVRIDKRFLNCDDRVLIIDDFLADGEALNGLIDIVNQAGATVVGAGICIEKGFQPGGKRIRSAGINLHSLAIVDIDENDCIKFKN